MSETMKLKQQREGWHLLLSHYFKISKFVNKTALFIKEPEILDFFIFIFPSRGKKKTIWNSGSHKLWIFSEILEMGGYSD